MKSLVQAVLYMPLKIGAFLAYDKIMSSSMYEDYTYYAIALEAINTAINSSNQEDMDKIVPTSFERAIVNYANQFFYKTFKRSLENTDFVNGVLQHIAASPLKCFTYSIILQTFATALFNAFDYLVFQDDPMHKTKATPAELKDMEEALIQKGSFNVDDIRHIKQDFEKLKVALNVDKDCKIIFCEGPGISLTRYNIIRVGDQAIKNYTEAALEDKEAAYSELKAFLAFKLQALKEMDFPGGYDLFSMPLLKAGLTLSADAAVARLGLREPFINFLYEAHDVTNLAQSENTSLIGKMVSYSWCAFERIDNLIMRPLSLNPHYMIRELHMRFVENFFSPISISADAIEIREEVLSAESCLHSADVTLPTDFS